MQCLHECTSGWAVVTLVRMAAEGSGAAIRARLAGMYGRFLLMPIPSGRIFFCGRSGHELVGPRFLWAEEGEGEGEG